MCKKIGKKSERVWPSLAENSHNSPRLFDMRAEAVRGVPLPDLIDFNPLPFFNIHIPFYIED